MNLIKHIQVNRGFIIALIVLAGVFGSSCDKNFQSASEMFQWINDVDNGLVMTKVINGVEIQVKYLPPEFLTYRELKQESNYSKSSVDSLLNLYQNSYSFLLKIGPEDANNSADIMLKGISSMEDFNYRAQMLNFEMAEYISLKANGEIYKPVLSTMENVYGMHSHRNIYIVFSPNDQNKSLLKAEKLDISFNDELFETGISHFVFKKKSISKIPKVNFWKYQ